MSADYQRTRTAATTREAIRVLYGLGIGTRAIGRLLDMGSSHVDYYRKQLGIQRDPPPDLFSRLPAEVQRLVERARVDRTRGDDK